MVRGKNIVDLQRKIMVSVVTADVNARDIVDELKQGNCSSVYDFKWVKQLRHYWDEDLDDCRIK